MPVKKKHPKISPTPRVRRKQLRNHVRDMAILMRYERRVKFDPSSNGAVREIAQEFGVTSDDVRRIVALERRIATSGNFQEGNLWQR